MNSTNDLVSMFYHPLSLMPSMIWDILKRRCHASLPLTCVKSDLMTPRLTVGHERWMKMPVLCICTSYAPGIILNSWYLLMRALVTAGFVGNMGMLPRVSVPPGKLYLFVVKGFIIHRSLKVVTAAYTAIDSQSFQLSLLTESSP